MYHLYRVVVFIVRTWPTACDHSSQQADIGHLTLSIKGDLNTRSLLYYFKFDPFTDSVSMHDRMHFGPTRTCTCIYLSRQKSIGTHVN